MTCLVCNLCVQSTQYEAKNSYLDFCKWNVLKVVSECTCVDPKPVEINELDKYVELLRDDIQHKREGLIKVGKKTNQKGKARAPANKT